MSTRIYCPRCEWAPGPHDRWVCYPGCHTIWNTFETRARCPGCSKVWKVTQCLVCLARSLHEHWYHDEVTDADERADSVEPEEVLVGAGAPEP
ncbi:MAG TPA: hypothetical protein VJ803_07885 [Gemmatimonadaceae bacterium]|nr:hypothetical protein [Gemmatimonadaceae bacterium]